MQDSSHSTYDVAIIGGGAAGFFAAIQLTDLNPKLKVILLEKTEQVLSKVKVSGGGRCNVTHKAMAPKAFAKNYPRGEKELRKLFHIFSAEDTIAWFAQKGVKLKTESDGRLFPESNSSQTIIDCFLSEAKKNKVNVYTKCAVIAIHQKQDHFLLETSSQGTMYAHQVIACTGGKPNTTHYQWIQPIREKITALHPSLFTFNAEQHLLKNLAGISVPHAKVRIRNSKLEEQGPLLITHWGLSGPAILRLSAWGAVELADKKYEFDVLIAWDHSFTEILLKEKINFLMKDHGKKKITNTPFDPLPKRLWEMLIKSADISEELTWNNVNHKKINKLIEQLISFHFSVKGKTTFKEEFVTAGGIDLDNIVLDRMESKNTPGLYFAGELINIDGITGGFNFQAAWTTAFIAAQSVAEFYKN